VGKPSFPVKLYNLTIVNQNNHTLHSKVSLFFAIQKDCFVLNPWNNSAKFTLNLKDHLQDSNVQCAKMETTEHNLSGSVKASQKSNEDSKVVTDSTNTTTQQTQQRKGNQCTTCKLSTEIPTVPMYGPYNLRDLTPGKTYLWCRYAHKLLFFVFMKIILRNVAVSFHFHIYHPAR
jgi:hypothetical protein